MITLHVLGTNPLAGDQLDEYPHRLDGTRICRIEDQPACVGPLLSFWIGFQDLSQLRGHSDTILNAAGIDRALLDHVIDLFQKDIEQTLGQLGTRPVALQL